MIGFLSDYHSTRSPPSFASFHLGNSKRFRNYVSGTWGKGQYFLLFHNYKIFKKMGAYFFLPVTCKIMLRHEIFPSGLRESVKICKLLPDAVATFPFAALGEKKT